MIFVLSLSVLQWIVLAQVFKMLRLMYTGDVTHANGVLSIMAMLTCAALAGLPLLCEYAVIAGIADGVSLLPSNDYLPLWFLGGAGVLTVVVFGLRLYWQSRNPTENAGFFAVGANATALMVGLYLLFVVSDQLAFYSPPRDDAGMVNWGFFRERGDVKDVECRSDIIVVKGLNSKAATYRCPIDGLAVIGRYTGTPIFPWPAYSEGTSRELGAELRKLKVESVKLKNSNE